MILVNKIILVSGVQFHNTSFVFCVVCSPPWVKSPSITIYPPFPSGNRHAVVCVYEGFFSLIPLLFSPSPPALSPMAAVSLFSESMILFLFCLFCSSDFTYKWDHMVFVFLWLAYSLSMFSWSIHTVAKSKISFFLWLNSIPLCKYTTAFLSTHLLTNSHLRAYYL